MSRRRRPGYEDTRGVWHDLREPGRPRDRQAASLALPQRDARPRRAPPPARADHRGRGRCRDRRRDGPRPAGACGDRSSTTAPSTAQGTRRRGEGVSDRLAAVSPPDAPLVEDEEELAPRRAERRRRRAAGAGRRLAHARTCATSASPAGDRRRLPRAPVVVFPGSCRPARPARGLPRARRALAPTATIASGRRDGVHCRAALRRAPGPGRVNGTGPDSTDTSGGRDREQEPYDRAAAAVASVWITTHDDEGGGKRYRVEYRLGGRESMPPRRLVQDEAARDDPRRLDRRRACRAARPRPRALDAEPPTLADARRGLPRRGARRASTSTSRPAKMHRSALAPSSRSRRAARTPIDELDVDDVTALVAALTEAGYKRETINKSRDALAMVLDHHRIEPNAARDKRVKLPKERRPHVPPPLAEHVERVAETLPRQHVLPLLIVDECGPRVNELATAQVGDLDEHRRAIRVRWTVEKNDRYRHSRAARRPVRRAPRDAAAARGPRARGAAVPRT